MFYLFFCIISFISFQMCSSFPLLKQDFSLPLLSIPLLINFSPINKTSKWVVLLCFLIPLLNPCKLASFPWTQPNQPFHFFFCHFFYSIQTALSENSAFLLPWNNENSSTTYLWRFSSLHSFPTLHYLAFCLSLDSLLFCPTSSLNSWSQ